MMFSRVTMNVLTLLRRNVFFFRKNEKLKLYQRAILSNFASHHQACSLLTNTSLISNNHGWNFHVSFYL